MFLVLKVLISATIITVLSEVSKRMPGIGGFFAAMPITTLLVLIWLYIEKRDLNLLADFSTSVFWAIIPSLFFFIPPMLLFRKGYSFYFVMALSLGMLFIGFLIHRRFIG